MLATLFFILSIVTIPVMISTISSPQHIFINPESSADFEGIPTIHQSAIQARRILNLSSIATISTVFPSTSDTPRSRFENRPGDLAGTPIGLMDYYASCGPNPENPSILAIGIATSFRNAHEGSNVTLSLRYHPPEDHPPSDDIYTYSPANLPRFSLIGHIEPVVQREVEDYDIKSCFLERHPDAELWLPGNQIHNSWWAKLVVEEVYWIGGFGDRAYIGWIPLQVYRAVTDKEVREARLVGERGWINEEARDL